MAGDPREKQTELTVAWSYLQVRFNDDCFLLTRVFRGLA